MHVEVEICQRTSVAVFAEANKANNNNNRKRNSSNEEDTSRTSCILVTFVPKTDPTSVCFALRNIIGFNYRVFCAKTQHIARLLNELLDKSNSHED